jgi:hypothetical protein
MEIKKRIITMGKTTTEEEKEKKEKREEKGEVEVIKKEDKLTEFFLDYEYPEVLAERIEIDLHALKLKGRLAFARDRIGDTEFVCFDNKLTCDFTKEFDDIIHSISADNLIVLASGDRLYVLDKEGEELWDKKIKNISMVAHRQDKIAVYDKNKVTVFDTDGKRLYKVKVKDALSMDVGEYLFIGTKDGLYVFSDDGEELGHYELGTITGVKILSNFLALSTEREAMLLTETGRVIWKRTVTHDLEDTIVDLDTSAESIEVHTFSGKCMMISKNGKSITMENLPYRYLPKPRISLPFMLEHIERIHKAIKPRSKDVNRLLKVTKKSIKKDNYREALFTIETALETINKHQLQVIIPKRVFGKFKIVLRPHNYTLKELKVAYDLSEMKDFFKLSKTVVEFPPIMRGMYVEDVVEAEPIYSGKIPFKVNIVSTKTSFTFVQTINVKRGGFSLSFKLFEGKGGRGKKKGGEKRRLSDLLIGGD